MLSIFLFISYILVLTFFGETLSKKALRSFDQALSFYERMPINFLLGLGVHIISAHFIAFISSSYRVGARISIALMIGYLIYMLYNKKLIVKEFFENSNRASYLLFISTLIISISCAIRGHLTDSDNTHIAWMSSVVRNNFYPPNIPVDKSCSLTFYHYGIDLICSSINSVTGLMPWDAISFQVGIGAFLVISSVFCFTKLFLNRLNSRVFATFIICFFTSTVALEFFYKYITKISQIGLYQFLHHWQNAGLTSVVDIPYYLVLISQSMGLAPILVILFLVFIAEKNNYKANYYIYPCLSILSFIAYFAYSAFWYPTFIGLGLYFFLANIKSFKLNNLINPALILLSVFIGKLLTLQFSSTNISDVNTMVVQPSLYWDHYAMNFLSYFDFNIDNNFIKPITDYNSGKTVFAVHLFSLTTMRNFGFIFLAAFGLLIYQLYKKSLGFLLVLFLSALPALTVPFILRFVPKYTEMYRFPAFGTNMLVIFIVISCFVLLENENNCFYKLQKNIFVKVLIVFHLMLVLTPGVIATLPNFSYNQFASDDLLDKEEKNLIKHLMKYQHSGDIALTTKLFYTFCDLSSVAGFYGVGGQMYKPDWQTRSTAVYLLNPLLLKELNVKYVLIYKDDKLSDLALKRLNDPSLFRELIDIHQVHPDYRFFEFNSAKVFDSVELTSLQNEYRWIIGAKLGQSFTPLVNNSQSITASTKQELSPLVKQYKTILAKDNIPAAVWLTAQAIPR